MTRVALVTCDDPVVRGHDDDAAPLAAALGQLGVEVVHPAWSDPDMDWGALDVAVLRSPWDYPRRAGEFLDWVSRAGAATRLRNHPDLVRWNVDKRHLADLAAAGVPVVPTTVAATPAELDEALTATFDAGAAEVVVKPSVSGGSRLTGRFGADAGGRDAAAALGRRILDEGVAGAVVQPAVVSVVEHGELSLVHIAGELRHARRREPMLATLGHVREAPDGSASRAEDPDPAQRDVAAAALGALGPIGERLGWAPGAHRTLYARVDLVTGDDGEPLLLELEVVEPHLALAHHPATAAALAAAIAAEMPDAGGGVDG